MRIFDTPVNTNVPAGQAPRVLLEIFKNRCVSSALRVMAYDHPNSDVLAHKITELAEFIAAIIDESTDDEIVGDLRLFVTDIDAEIVAMKLEHGQDWNPEYTIDLPTRQLIDAFLILARHSYTLRSSDISHSLSRPTSVRVRVRVSPGCPRNSLHSSSTLSRSNSSPSNTTVGC